MNKFRFYLAGTLLALIMSSGHGFGQILDPAHWQTSIKSLGNQEYELVLSAKLDDGWCIYSQTSDPEAAIPTEVTIKNSQGLTLIGKVEERGKLKKAAEPLFDNKILAKYYEHVDFVQKIKITDKVPSIQAEVYFMCCNSETCIPPTTKTFQVNVMEAGSNNGIVPGGQGSLPVSGSETLGAKPSEGIFDPVHVTGGLKKLMINTFCWN